MRMSVNFLIRAGTKTRAGQHRGTGRETLSATPALRSVRIFWKIFRTNEPHVRTLIVPRINQGGERRRWKVEIRSAIVSDDKENAIES